MTTAPLRGRPGTASGEDRPPESLTRRGWFVVAMHRAPHREGGPHPWGTAHLKQVGASHTACGEPARGWRGFWHLDFRTDVESPCPECATGAGLDLRRR